jgi:hypothetical protein
VFSHPTVPETRPFEPPGTGSGGFRLKPLRALHVLLTEPSALSQLAGGFLEPRFGHQRGVSFPSPLQTESRAMTDLRVTLKYGPQHRTNRGPRATPAVRVCRLDSEGVTLQIRREHVSSITVSIS